MSGLSPVSATFMSLLRREAADLPDADPIRELALDFFENLIREAETLLAARRGG